MLKQAKLVRQVILTGLVLVLTVLFIQKFYVPPDDPSTISAPGMSETLGVINSLIITLFCSISVFIHVLNQGKINIRLLIILTALSSFIVLSLHNGGWKSGPFTVISIFITYIFFLDILQRAGSQELIIKLVKYFFSIAAILPILIYILLPTSREGLETYEGHFRGFETSRTTYGYSACIAFTLHLIQRRRGWQIWISLIMFGIFLAQTRIAILLFVIVSLYILIYDQRIRYRKLALSAFLITTPLFIIGFITFGARGDEALEESQRQFLIITHINYAMNNLLFGSGGNVMLDTIVMGDGTLQFKPSPAHNFIIETLVGFGLLATILWLYLLWALWRRTNSTGHIFIILLIIYGTLHNGFGLSVMNSSSYIIFILTVCIRDYFDIANYARHEKLIPVQLNSRTITNHMKHSPWL